MNITMGLFRIKSYEFTKTGFMFEMPKQLTLSDIAFRAVFSQFDHLSTKSASYYLRVKDKPAEGVTQTKTLHITF